MKHCPKPSSVCVLSVMSKYVANFVDRGCDADKTPYRSKAPTVKNTDLNRILNTFSNQRLRFNMRKVIQLAALYHRSNERLRQLGRLAARGTMSSSSCNVFMIKREVLFRAQRCRVAYKKQKSIRRGASLMECALDVLADQPFIALIRNLFVNDALSTCVATVRPQYADQVPILAMRTESEIDRVVDACRRARIFPYDILPPDIRPAMKALIEC